MKNILKLAVAFLLIFAMIGMASAADEISVNIVSEMGDSTGYTIEFDWTDDGSIDAYRVIITGPGGPDEVYNDVLNTKTKTFSSILAAGIYLITVSDSTNPLINGELSFTVKDPVVLNPPVFASFKSETDSSKPNVYTLTWIWNRNTIDPNVKLEYYDVSSSEWKPTDDAKTDFEIPGDSTKDLMFRLNGTIDGTQINSTNTTIFKPITFTNTSTSNSIEWKVVLPDGMSLVENDVIVTKKGDSTELPRTLSGNTVTASTLDSNTEYTLSVRGSSSYGKGLWTSNDSKTEAAIIDFIDTIESSKEIVDDDGKPKNFGIENDTTVQINITATEKVDFVWKLEFYDSENDKWVEITKNGNYTVENSDDLKSNFSWKPSKVGEYRLNLIMTSQASGTSQTLSWNKITVTEKSTGNRIWKDGMPDPYTWDARSFSGFYYNLDTGDGNESMTMKGMSSGRSIDKGDLTYTTTTSVTDYSYSPWNTYEIVGFMGDKYFAGDSKSSLMKNGNLSKVLLDNNDKVQLRTGQYYALEEGYSIYVNQISVKGSQAQIAFYKDGKEIGSSIATSGNDLEYTKKIGSGSGNETVIIKTRLKSVFQGTESSIVELEGFFQISENLTRLESGTKIGKMEIKNVGNDKIEMENHERISLSQNSTIDLMGKVKITVADTNALRFAPFMEYTEPGVYEIRGTVSDYGETDFVVYEWNPEKFEGFYYDINDDIDFSEMIKINQTLTDSSRSIDKGKLEYSSKVTKADYNFSKWGQYSVVGFMGEKYYAGLGGSLLKDGNLSKVLVDTDEKRNMRLGDSLVLEDGISIKIEQIDTNGNKARLLIEQNGKELSSGIVSAGEDLVYNGSNSKIKDTPFIKVHVDSVFMGTESSIVSITGVFQASINLTKLDTDTKYGKMKVDGYTSTGISLSSDERITLSQGNDVDFMKVGNDSMYFKVGDSNTLRFAPIVERTIGSTDPLTVKLNSSNVTSGDAVLITLNDRGTTIEGVTVYVNGSQIGTTNSSGEITYKTSAVGSFKVTGEKTGFVNGSATLNVAEKLINMTVRVSPETVYFGTPATIKATDSLNGSALSGATVYISGESVGTTDSSGELNYTFNKTGSITVDVSKSGYNNGTKTVDISQKVAFAYGNFTLKPNEPSAKKAIKLSIDIANNGIEDGSHDLSLILTDTDGNIIDQDNSSVSVKVGKSKSVTLSVKAPEEGAYKMILKEADSNRTIDLPSNMSTISVGEAKFGSTILYVILGGIGMIVIVVIGIVAYLFGIKGATTSNYKEVAGELTDDIKSKFNKK